MQKPDSIFMDIRQCYEILELDPGASAEEVDQAYKELIKVWRPDRFLKIPRLKRKADKKFKAINEAYERLQPYLSDMEPLKCDAASQIGADRTAISRDITDGKLKKTSRNLARAYPLARCLARFIDYLLFGLLLTYMNVYGILLRFDIPMPLFPIISIFAWVFVEAALLKTLGTSPGKWLLKTTVIDRSLEKPGYFGALVRSLSVWCNGMGTGIFFIAPVTMAISYQKLKKEGYAQWDREGKFYLIHGKVGTPRFLFAFLFLVIFSVLNTYEMHQRTGFLPVKLQAFKSPDEMAIQRGKTAAITQNTPIQKRQGNTTSDYTDAQYRLGKICSELGRYEEAIEALTQVVRVRPGFAEAQYGLGISYANMGLYGEAEKALMQAIQLKPDYAEAHHILGFVYLDIGEKKAAIKQQEILKDLDKGLSDELLVYIDMPTPENGISPPKSPWASTPYRPDLIIRE